MSRGLRTLDRWNVHYVTRIKVVDGSISAIPQIFAEIPGEEEVELQLGVQLLPEDRARLVNSSRAIGEIIVAIISRVSGIEFDSYKQGLISEWFRKGR